MAGGRKLMIWTISAMVLLAIAASSILVFRYFSKQVIPVMHSVPEETVILVRPLELKHLESFTRENEKLLGHLKGIPLTEPLVSAMSRIRHAISEDRSLAGLLSSNELLLAWVREKDTSLKLLVLFQLNDIMEVRAINSFLSGTFPAISDMPGTMDHEIRRIDGTIPFYFNISNGIFSGSPSQEVLIRSLDQRKDNRNPFSGPVIDEIMATSGQNVDANIYFNTGNINPLIFNTQHGVIGGHAALDLLIKENGLLLNGFVAPGPEALSAVFSGTGPGRSGCPDVLPSNTIEFYHIIFHEFDSLYHSLYMSGVGTENIKGDVHASDNEKQHFKIWPRGELTVARTSGGDLLAVFSIRENSDPIEELGIITKKETAQILSKDVYLIEKDALLKDITRPFFGDMPLSCFCRIDSNIVFAGSIDAMTKTIRAHTMGRTLAASDLYSLETANITENSHLYHYIDLTNTIYRGELLRPGPLGDLIGGEGEAHRHFPAFMAQYTFTGKWYYTNLSIAFVDTLPEEGAHIWQADLDSEAESGPFLISDPALRSDYLLVTDKENRAYLFSTHGEKAWEVQLSSQPLGKPDVMISGSTSYIVFNTSTRLHKIDLTGQEGSGFPVTLSAESATGMKLIRYPENGDYRILIPGKDRRMYNYTAAGNEIRGWKNPAMPGEPSGMPQYLVKKGKDYLIFSDSDGNVLITDRRGRERTRYKGDFANSGNSGLFLNQTNSKGLFITTDIRGHLIYIPEKGRIQKTVFGDFSSDHYFFYTDMNEDGNEDFVYFDNLNMKVFDRFKKILVQADLPEKPASKPLRIATEGKQKSFFFQGTSGKIYQVHLEGNVITEEYLISDSGFAAWKDKDTGMIFVSVTSDRKLIIYPF